MHHHSASCYRPWDLSQLLDWDPSRGDGEKEAVQLREGNPEKELENSGKRRPLLPGWRELERCPLLFWDTHYSFQFSTIMWEGRIGPQFPHL